MIGGLLRVLVVALVVLVGAMLLLVNMRAPAPTVTVATVLDQPRPLPEVALTDTAGQPFSLADLKGRYALVFFGYTNCPDVCPLSLAALTDAMSRLRERAPDELPAVVFISVDSARDTPDRIGAYLKSFDPAFVGATADAATLKPLLTALSVTVHKDHESGGNYTITHNGTIYVLDDTGRWLALFGGSTPKPMDIVHDYLAMRAQAAAG